MSFWSDYTGFPVYCLMSAGIIVALCLALVAGDNQEPRISGTSSQERSFSQMIEEWSTCRNLSSKESSPVLTPTISMESTMTDQDAKLELTPETSTASSPVPQNGKKLHGYRSQYQKTAPQPESTLASPSTIGSKPTSSQQLSSAISQGCQACSTHLSKYDCRLLIVLACATSFLAGLFAPYPDLFLPSVQPPAISCDSCACDLQTVMPTMLRTQFDRIVNHITSHVDPWQYISKNPQEKSAKRAPVLINRGSRSRPYLRIW